MISLHPRVIQLWRLQGLVRLATFWGPLIAGLTVFVGFRAGLNLGFGVGVGLLLLLVPWTLGWPSLSWSHYHYGVRGHDLLVERGVLFRRTISIPLDRIQHVDTRQGPLERLFGLSRVVVYTAAGMSADGSIPGLEEDDANRLRDTLARRTANDGV